jgi:hypothetical protein
MALFFIDTDTGQIATRRQLVEAGLMTDTDGPERPWFRIQGTDDATTLWYAVLRKRTRGIFIGALAIRHSDHHASLLNEDWEEVTVEELRAWPAAGSLPEA